MSDTHAANPKAQAKFLAYLLGPMFAAAFVLYLATGIMLPLIGVLIGIMVSALYLVFAFFVIEPTGSGVEKMLVPTGSSTPSVAQHSNIEALEVRGEYAKAAAAYRDIIETQPEDLVACEKLGQLALRQLKDFETAIWAYRQAEQRHPEPRRRAGYALMVVNIYRDNVGDPGRTLVELRKLLAKYPELPNADQLRAEAEEMKARHFEAT